MDNCFCIDSLSPNSSHELGEYLYIKLKDIFIENGKIRKEVRLWQTLLVI